METNKRRDFKRTRVSQGNRDGPAICYGTPNLGKENQKKIANGRLLLY
jgi:hypothetical protein